MALEGKLSDLSVVDLIQLVDLSKKTGIIHIQGQQLGEPVEGWLHFRDGRIVGAVLGDLLPYDAALGMFALHDGDFRLHEQPVTDTTITSSNEMIIMEGIGRQDRWQEIEAQIPSLSIVLRLVQNPDMGSQDISLAADDWRVLTMINGKNTVGQIAERTSLGLIRTCEIVAALLNGGLVEKKALSFAESLFPQLEELARGALGSTSQVLLSEAYRRVGIDHAASSATDAQVLAAIDSFEEAVRLLMGRSSAVQLAQRMRDRATRILSSR